MHAAGSLQQASAGRGIGSGHYAILAQPHRESMLESKVCSGFSRWRQHPYSSTIGGQVVHCHYDRFSDHRPDS